MPGTPPRLVTLFLLTELTVVTTNMFLPALPQMQADFGVSEVVIGLSISLYMAAALLQILLGPLSDRVGRRPVSLACLAVYALASVIAVQAQDIAVFLAPRTAQSVAVAGGVLTDGFGWRAAFLACAMLRGGLLVWAVRDLGETRARGWLGPRQVCRARLRSCSGRCSQVLPRRC